MDTRVKAALAVLIVIMAGLAPATAQKLDSRIDNNKRDTALCHDADPDKAINGCTNIIRMAPDTAIGAGCSAVNCATNTPNVAAAGIFSNSDVVNAYLARALAYLKKSRFDEAIGDCTRLLSFVPNSASCYGIRAAAFAGKNLDDNALADAEKGVAIDPGDAGILATRGQVYEKIGAKDEAIADYRRAIQLDPNLSLARLGLVRLGAP